MTRRVGDAKATGPPRTQWGVLYALGGAAAIAVVALVPVGAAVYFIWPPPTTAVGYFTIFHENPLIGLLNQDLLLIVDQVLMIVVTLALYVALRRSSESIMAIALVLAVTGAVLFIASNTAFNMLGLSAQYAAATTDQQRSSLEAAGVATLAGYQGTTFVMGYLLTGVADLVMAVVMLRSVAFGKLTAYVGIVYGVTALVPPIPATGSIGLVVSFVSLLPMVVWLVLVARALFRLNRSAGAVHTWEARTGQMRQSRAQPRTSLSGMPTRQR
jgi:hypothetical protein